MTTTTAAQCKHPNRYQDGQDTGSRPTYWCPDCNRRLWWNGNPIEPRRAVRRDGGGE